VEEAVIGVDPGAKGAYCILVPGTNQIYFVDANLPPLTIHELLQYYRDHFSIQHIRLEDVHSIYGMSAKSNFNFGSNVREAYLQLLFADFQTDTVRVTPKIWQKTVGVTAKGKLIKQDVAGLCQSLYPNCPIFGPRGGLMDGRSDSLMIAHYAHLTR